MMQLPASATPSSAGGFSPAAYVQAQKELLELERAEEVRQVSLSTSSQESLSATEAAGLAVTRLSLVEQTSALGDRSRAIFSTRGGRVVSPARLSSGDIVAVRGPPPGPDSPAESRVTQGVLTGLEDTRLIVVLEEPIPEHTADSPALYAIIKATSDVTHSRYRTALDEFARAADSSSHPAHGVIGAIFGLMSPRFQPTLSLTSAQESVIASLNSEQRHAVELGLRSMDAMCIHGPPGTGKTTALVSLILAEVARGSRVLVAAPSNVAADNIAERLAAASPRPRFVRAGHPARVLPGVAPFLLEAQVAQSDEAALVRDIRREIDIARENARTAKKFSDRRAHREEQRILRKELRKREGDAVKRLLASMEVVVCTLTGAGARVLEHANEKRPFDLVVVDEAGQALEAAAWIALLRGKRAVLAGDPFQLPPTVLCDDAAKRGLGQTLMDRIFARKAMSKDIVCMLTVQYRMNRVISDWSSKALYEGRLVPDDGVGDRLLVGVAKQVDDGAEEDGGDLTSPFVIIDTADGDCDEDGDGEDAESGVPNLGGARTSRRNLGEAGIVVEYVDSLVRSGIDPKLIGVISPYAGQVELLRDRLRGRYGKALEIATVDSFQGREKEAIIISLVRANDAGNVGFLKEDRRMNVAITRARRSVVIVCDSATVKQHPFLRDMLEYAEQHGDYRTAIAEYPEIVGHGGNSRKPMEAVRASNKSKKGKKAKKKARSQPQTSVDSGIAKADTAVSALKAKNIGGPAGKESEKNTAKMEAAHDRDNAVYQRMEKLVDMFENSDMEEHSFPKTLSSFERRLIHELAEQRKLGHETTGDNHGRVIRIWKIVDGDTPAPVERGDEEDSTVQSSLDPVGPSVGSGTVSKRNKLLHEAALARSVRAEEMKKLVRESPNEIEGIDNAESTTEDVDVDEPAHVVKPQKSKRGKQKKGKRGKSAKEEDEDFDAVLKEYGAPQPKEIRDPVIRIMNGTLKVDIPGASANKKPTPAQEKLAKKLAEAAKERGRKQKNK